MNVRDMREAMNALGSEHDLLPVLVAMTIDGGEEVVVTVQEVKVLGGQYCAVRAS